MRNISDVMTEDVYLVTPEQTIAEAALLMREKDVGSVAVHADDKLVGMLTDRDLAIRAVADGLDSGTRVRDVMTEASSTASTTRKSRTWHRTWRNWKSAGCPSSIATSGWSVSFRSATWRMRRKPIPPACCCAPWPVRIDTQ
jgi:CBS domain-containing protein